MEEQIRAIVNSLAVLIVGTDVFKAAVLHICNERINEEDTLIGFENEKFTEAVERIITDYDFDEKLDNLSSDRIERVVKNMSFDINVSS
jgi:hypothetical protein